MNIDIHIEELILEGFEPGSRYRVAQAIKVELTRLFSQHGVPQMLSQGGDIADLDAGSFNINQGANPDSAGIKIAGAIYGGLKK